MKPMILGGMLIGVLVVGALWWWWGTMKPWPAAAFIVSAGAAGWLLWFVREEWR